MGENVHQVAKQLHEAKRIPPRKGGKVKVLRDIDLEDLEEPEIIYKGTYKILDTNQRRVRGKMVTSVKFDPDPHLGASDFIWLDIGRNPIKVVA